MDKNITELKTLGAKTAIILGSGLGAGFVNGLEKIIELPFEDVGLPTPTVPGHAGTILGTRLNNTPLVVVQGRSHLYEAQGAEAVVKSVEFLQSIGITTIILTNAAGALNPSFELGKWMLLSDHINMTGQTPLIGPEFISMINAYSPRLRAMFKKIAPELFEGIYLAIAGPQFETPAEIRMFRHLGADAVGMSTVMEVIKARSLNLEVVALSYLSNWGAGMTDETTSHMDVLVGGSEAAVKLQKIIESALPNI